MSSYASRIPKATSAGLCESVPTVQGTPARQNAESNLSVGYISAQRFTAPAVFTSTMRPPARAASAMRAYRGSKG